MVNQLQRMRVGVVKLEAPLPGERRVTSKGGLALAQALLRRVRLASDMRCLLPGRKDPRQGFEVPAVLVSLIHGLLSGGRGFSATEPMREDAPLLALLGLSRAPSAETVEQVIKYLALECENVSEPLGRLLSRNAAALLSRTARPSLTMAGGFVPVWADGTLLEVEGECFDALKVKDGRRGQICAGAFVGPYLTGVQFAGQGVGEETVGRALIDGAVKQVLRPGKLMHSALVLMDSLYGDGPTLEQLEAYRERPAFILGAQKLATAQRVMMELPERCWRSTGAHVKRGWEDSGVAQAWVQCEDWTHKRLMVCRRWRKRGEMIWNFAAVLTNLSPRHERVEKLMRQWKVEFEEVVWRLYGHKQAMENQWKDLLSDLGLHHPPCARAAVNAVFYAVAALAYNLTVGVRLLGLDGQEQRMRLWRLRREWFDVAASVARHGRCVVVRLLLACDARIARLLAAMNRLARC